MTEYYITPDMQTRLKRLSGSKVAQIKKVMIFKEQKATKPGKCGQDISMINHYFQQRKLQLILQ